MAATTARRRRTATAKVSPTDRGKTNTRRVGTLHPKNPTAEPHLQEREKTKRDGRDKTDPTEEKTENVIGEEPMRTAHHQRGTGIKVEENGQETRKPDPQDTLVDMSTTTPRGINKENEKKREEGKKKPTPNRERKVIEDQVMSTQGEIDTQVKKTLVVGEVIPTLITQGEGRIIPRETKNSRTRDLRMVRLRSLKTRKWWRLPI